MQRSVSGRLSGPAGRPSVARRAAKTLAGGGRQWRDASVRRVDDERGAGVQLPLDQPERVVVAGSGIELAEARIAQHLLDQQIAEQVAGLLALAQLGQARLEIRQLLAGQRLLACQRLRAFQRRRGVVGPDALQVRLAVRGARCRPARLLRGRTRSLRSGSTRGHDRNRHGHPQCQRQPATRRHRSRSHRHLVVIVSNPIVSRTPGGDASGRMPAADPCRCSVSCVRTKRACQETAFPRIRAIQLAMASWTAA